MLGLLLIWVLLAVGDVRGAHIGGWVFHVTPCADCSFGLVAELHFCVAVPLSILCLYIVSRVLDVFAVLRLCRIVAEPWCWCAFVGIFSSCFFCSV